MKKPILIVICLCIMFPALAQIASAVDISTISPSGLAMDIKEETISGVSTLMEYSTNRSRWISVREDPLDISNLIPSASARADVTLSIRYKAPAGSPTSLPSLSTDFVLTRRPAPPTASAARFNGDTESIAVNDLMEFREGARGSFTEVPAGVTRVPLEIEDTAQRFQVRYKATATDFASASRSIFVPSRRAEPRSTYNGSEDSIRGVGNSMEFSLDNGATWTPVTASSIPRSQFGAGATEVLVRYKATASAASSSAKAVTIPAASTTSPGGLALDAIAETVSGVTDQMEYSTTGSRWTKITANPLSISNLIPSAGARGDVTLLIRAIAAGGNPASQTTSILLPRRPAAPPAADVRFDGFTESIRVSDAMETRPGTSGAFTAVPAGATSIPVTVGDSSQRHQVRLKATTSAFASASRSVLVPARRAAPNSSYDGSMDRVKGVSASMEYSFDGGTTWLPVTSNAIPRSELGSSPVTISVRLAATSSSAASHVRNIAVPAASTTIPTGITLSIPSETVSGVSNLMEYSTNGTKWTAISADPLDISKLVPSAGARSDVTLSIRYKAVPGSAASIPFSITLAKRPATPTTAMVKFNGLTESITASATSLMEYRQGSLGVFTPVSGGNIPVTVGPAQLRYQVRFSATAATFASAARSVTVPARRAAPNAVYNAGTDRIAGVSSSMEFSLDGGTVWTPVTSSGLTRAEFGSAAITVMIRLKATASSASSNIKTVNVPAV